MKLNLSTSMKSGNVADGRNLVKRLADLGVDGLELEYRIRPEALPGIRQGLLETGLGVSSVHNYFPVPDVHPPRGGSGDFFNMASLDPEECREAVKWATRSIEQAAAFGARAMVVHAGRVDMNAAIPEIKAAYRENRMEDEPVRHLIKAKTAELAFRKPAHFDRLLHSLDKLLRVAEHHQVRVGLENRYHYHELPGIDDFTGIFSRFSGAPIGFWYDTGHDNALTLLGFHPAGTLLDQNADHLVGMHIHDANGLNDHLPPGTGEIDFTPILSRLNPETLCVFELLPGTDDAAAARGIETFRRRLSEFDQNKKP